MNASSSSRCLQILEFWHKIEFFIPFDLCGQVLKANDAQWNVKRITASVLASIPRDASGDLWQVARVPEGKAVVGFDLYLGVFDKSVLAAVSDRFIGEVDSEQSSVDQGERGDLEGETCYARVKLNAFGEPQFDQVSVSTVPWALGLVQRGELEHLNFDSFQASLKPLQDDLLNFQAQRQQASQTSETIKETLPLTRLDVERLLEIFYAWARFEPDGNESMQAVVRVSVGKKPASNAKSESVQGRESLESDDEESETPAADEAGIDILNSFYVKDIERTIASLRQGERAVALENYLTPLPKEDRIDLYTPAGRRRIISDLHPANLPLAHWLGEPGHAMSLMQQFAINNIFSPLSKESLFSVNGPPGTGKTTLLRDIFAENITRRARILSGLEKAKDAFQPGSTTVEFEGSSTSWKISLLHPDLTGFEMVVASSNNAAVKNISEDLPKAKSLGTMDWKAPAEMAWREKDGTPKQTYLQTVAIRMAAQTSRGDFAALTSDDTPWGLVSCSLGRKANRQKFADRFSYSVIKKDRPKDAPLPKGYDSGVHQSFREWRDHYKGPAFREARMAFIELDKNVHERAEQLIRLSDLAAVLSGHTETTYTFEKTELLSSAQAAFEQAKMELMAASKDLALCLEKLEIIKEEGKLISAPSGLIAWLGRIPSTPFWRNPFHEKFRTYRYDIEKNRAKQRMLLQEKFSLKQQKSEIESAVEQAEKTVEAAKCNLQECVEDWQDKNAEYDELQPCFSKAAIPASPDDIEMPDWQINGIWFDTELNMLRSRLFSAALTLHEAWLVEVTAKGGGFSPNLYAACNLLQGKRLTQPDQALALWQSLFMAVPVISSTFASIALQFKDIGAQTLGWLFIDEAGQAVPQAAVGALWRARRAVVVGDPLQIEPVFTVPVRLIEALAKSSKLPEGMRVMPHVVSVQNLADDANACGTWVPGLTDEPEWVGSPLRVHRRCVDPMFQIANSIAYDNKMIFGLESAVPPSGDYDLGASAWVHVPGVTHGRHVVPAQIELVTRAVMCLYRSNRELPPLYIISPFKRIKLALQDSLSDIKAWKAQGITSLLKNDLDTWCRENIGTVHTFQGKEEKIVWMVLGCDKQGDGAVSWATGKPNILNVALTRAKHRFFIIGDMGLWGGKQYFHEARLGLPSISGDEFLGRIRTSPPITPP